MGSNHQKSGQQLQGTHCAERGEPRKAGSIYAANGPPRFEDVGAAEDCAVDLVCYQCSTVVGSLGVLHVSK